MARVIAVAAVVVFSGAVVFALRARIPLPGPVDVYLTPGASEEDIFRVYTTALGAPRSNGQGFTLHDGIASVMLAGDEAQTILVVGFQDGLSRRARERLIAAMRASPLVSRVEPSAPPSR